VRRRRRHLYAHSGPRGPRSRLAVRVDGTTFTIEIEEGPAGQLRARIDGTPVDVDARLASCGAGSLLLHGISYLVDLGEGAAETHVVVDGEAFRVQIDSPARRSSSAGARSSDGAGQRLVAPMPGKMVSVLVEVGQLVEAGAGLVVLEAMKMENEFRATVAGTVTEVHATPGQAVNAGDLLVVVA
jgi:biotin carboxyl carrier protein